MKISQELLRRCSSRSLVPSGDCSEPLARVSHLFLQEQRIHKIENLGNCKTLVALYLYDNKIQTIENLEDLNKLSCLYLQDNLLTSIQNLETLTQLSVLNLCQNSIRLVEGLDTLCQLRELYVDYQRLPSDQELEFSESSLNAISESLCVLSVSGNNLRSLLVLAPLRQLEVLAAEDNRLADLQPLVDAVGHWPRLRSARFAGNKVCSLSKYSDNLVVNCMDLEELDGRPVAQTYRNYLLNWKQHQQLLGRKKESYALLMPFLESQGDQPFPGMARQPGKPSSLVSKLTRMREKKSDSLSLHTS